jgi:hypothetical protein
VAKRRVAAVLWRNGNKATIDTLLDRSQGQYDIRLGSGAPLEDLFSGLKRFEGTDHGGYTVKIPVAGFDGATPVPEQTLDVRFMGPKSERKDWYVRAQRASTAYPLWRSPRAFTPANERAGDLALLVKDTSGAFHARWIRSGDRASLPSALRTATQNKETGVWVPSGVAAPASGAQNGPAAAVTEALLAHQNVLVYGPPATGKTRLVQDVMMSFGGRGIFIDTAEERRPIAEGAAARTAFVTFHQSYSYEEFVVGLRTVPGAVLDLRAFPGVLLELAEHARQPGNTALLVIDEINRGNVSRILGEFITLLERDKRLDDAGKETESTVRLRLPFARSGAPLEVELDGAKIAVPHPFTMPLRVYTLATMNSVDKSVAPLDSALRRRFHVWPLMPDPEAMAMRMKVSGKVLPQNWPASPTADDYKVLGLAVLRHLNDGIAAFRGPEYQLGHFFLRDLEPVDKPAAARAALAAIWRNQLASQLEELFHGRVDQLSALFGDAAKLPDAPIRIADPQPSLAAEGASPYVVVTPADDERVIQFLRVLVAKPAGAP